MTATEAHAAAEAEGPTLLGAENATGFKGVGFSHERQQSFQVEPVARRAHGIPGRLCDGGGGGAGRRRFLGPEGVAAVLAAAAPEPALMTATEAHARRRRRADATGGREPRWSWALAATRDTASRSR